MLDLTLWHWFILGLILLGACFVQGAVGFAAGMIFITLALFTGLPLPETIIISMIASMLQSLGGVWNLRAEVGGKHLLLPVVCRLIWLPIGVLALWQMDRYLDKSSVKQIVGVAILVAIGMLRLSNLPTRPQLPTWITVSTFSLSGFMHGAIGMAGPPVVLWLSMLDWSSQKNRVFLFQLFLASIPFQALILWITYPQRFVAATTAGLILSPTILLGSALGLWLGNRLDRQQLRTYSLIALALIGVVAILEPWLR